MRINQLDAEYPAEIASIYHHFYEQFSIGLAQRAKQRFLEKINHSGGLDMYLWHLRPRELDLPREEPVPTSC